jgi:hypothetical protein
MNENGMVILSNLVWQAPVLLAYIVVMVVAVVKWQEFPRPSMMLFWAAVLSLVVTVAYTVLQQVIVMQMGPNLNGPQVSMLLGATGLIATLIRAVAIALMVAAVYIGRQPPAPGPWDE